MSKTLSLPLRVVNPLRASLGPWSCRRCLATQPPARSTGREGTAVDTPDYNPALPFRERDYRLKKTDFYLKKALPHPIPPQYLEHSTSPILARKEAEQRESRRPHAQIVGVVVSAGKMAKTVKVRIATQRWEQKMKKHFSTHVDHLVHDPNSSLAIGDVVSLHRLRVSKTVRHVVASILAPFGTPTEARPPIPTPDERLAAYKQHRFAKLQRRSLQRQEANAEPRTGARDGESEQTPASRVLSEGRRESDNVNERARLNKQKATESEATALENAAEAHA